MTAVTQRESASHIPDSCSFIYCALHWPNVELPFLVNREPFQRVHTRTALCYPRPTSAIEIASMQSPPLSLIAAQTLKPSQNLYTELILELWEELYPLHPGCR